jgi:hypothetical protein
MAAVETIPAIRMSLDAIAEFSESVRLEGWEFASLDGKGRDMASL